MENNSSEPNNNLTNNLPNDNQNTSPAPVSGQPPVVNNGTSNPSQFSPQPAQPSITPSGMFISPDIQSTPPGAGGTQPPTVNEPANLNQVPGTAGVVGSFQSTSPPQKPKKKFLKPLIIAGAAILAIGGGASAYYYGYYMNPSVIWSQSLSNTGAGYNKLVSYLNTKSKVSYSGQKFSGNLNIKSGGTTITGNLNEQSDGSSSTASFKTSFFTTNIDFEARGVTAPNQSAPDIYLQFNGIKNLGLGSSLGVSDQQINKLDGQWIIIDHSILEQLQTKLKAELNSNQNNKPTLTKQDMIAAAQEFGTINSKYVFTSGKDSVTKVVKNIGFETVSGHKTYHYKVGFVKQNVKNYITAVRDGLQSSALGKWYVAQTGASINDLMGYDSMEQSADKIT